MKELFELVKSLKQDVEALNRSINQLESTNFQRLTEEWIDGKKVKTILGISNRKLQMHRDNGTLPYSQIDGKIYFKTSDIEDLLNKNYNKR